MQIVLWSLLIGGLTIHFFLKMRLSKRKKEMLLLQKRLLQITEENNLT